MVCHIIGNRHRFWRLLSVDRVAKLHGDRCYRGRIHTTSHSRNTATAERIVELQILAPTSLPTFTPVPSCEDFVVTVRTAIIRSRPSTNSKIVDSVDEGDTVCVIAKEPNSDWYVLDSNPLTRRLEAVYMHEDIIRALNPTPTQTPTPTPSTTPSPSPTFTRSPTPTPLPTRRQITRDAPSITPRPTITPTPASVRL